MISISKYVLHHKDTILSDNFTRHIPCLGKSNQNNGMGYHAMQYDMIRYMVLLAKLDLDTGADTFWCCYSKKLTQLLPNVMGASVSSGAHSGLVGVCCSLADELLPSLALDSAGLRTEWDAGSRELADSFSLAGDP